MLSRCVQGEGIKEVLFKKEDKSIKKLYAILYKALEDLDVLNRIYNIYLLKICKNKFLGIILLSVLVQRNQIDGGGKLRREIMKKEKAILQIYHHLKGLVSSISGSGSNVLKETKELTKYFVIYNDSKKSAEELKKWLVIEEDEDVKGLYKIRNDKVKSLIASRIYMKNKIRIIDKTSCLVVQAGNIKRGMVIVDICSSPGSKAICSLISLKKKGFLICIEKNKKRCYTLLVEILKNDDYIGPYTDEHFGEDTKFHLNQKNFFINFKDIYIYYIKHKNNELIIKIFNCNFLDLSYHHFEEFGQIDVVFVDPSCSSSGMPDFAYKENMRRVFPCARGEEKYRGGESCNDSCSDSCSDSRNDSRSDSRNDSRNDDDVGTRGPVEAEVSGALIKPNSNDAAEWSNVSNKKGTCKREIIDYNIYDDVSKGQIPRVPLTFVDKVKKLCEFQKNILNHALVNLKTAKTFIYSTCSFFEEENEQVIQNALRSNTNFSLEKAGTDKFLFNNGQYEFSNKCVRTFPGRDSCRGIFIAKICRTG
ncbi:S-adenosyl-L-methionine-dependent methyltransferase, putative [Plasmodium malariae]|uniref:S-adenosyl-L-methionine-dependent methyltransferase, putative n=1 Tax=Plasmodium malariae TaxID=5858 RepID=A0A1C3KB23_PLAMA|nr:S-adenosyl-L-methionine-dependent methyltransferase, putative [Plasmodium malariae]